MSGNKKDREKGFQQNPFKDLKGFCASSPKKGAPEKRPAQPPIQDDAELFAEEMERLGVSRTPMEESRKEKGENGPPASVTESEVKPPKTDREQFLASLGEMETVFCDEIPEEESPPAPPRRMRQVRRGELAPEAQLDLHGLTRDEARDRVRHFLDNASYHGRRTVLIVTGRGKGSGGEPVLRKEIERYLQHEAAAWVAEWGRAPARFGGEGALVVFLKGRRGTN